MSWIHLIAHIERMKVIGVMRNAVMPVTRILALLALACGTVIAAPAYGASSHAESAAGSAVHGARMSSGKPSSRLLVTFRKIGSTGASPAAEYGCSVYYPSASYTPPSAGRSGVIQYQGSVSCTVAVGLYGHAVLYTFSSGKSLSFGGQMNFTAPGGYSRGSYAVNHGSFGVNFVVRITPPTGYTTEPQDECSLTGAGQQIMCITTLGPLNY